MAHRLLLPIALVLLLYTITVEATDEGPPDIGRALAHELKLVDRSLAPELERAIPQQWGKRHLVMTTDPSSGQYIRMWRGMLLMPDVGQKTGVMKLASQGKAGWWREDPSGSLSKRIIAGTQVIGEYTIIDQNKSMIVIDVDHDAIVDVSFIQDGRIEHIVVKDLPAAIRFMQNMQSVRDMHCRPGNQEEVEEAASFNICREAGGGSGSAPSGINRGGMTDNDIEKLCEPYLRQGDSNCHVEDFRRKAAEWLLKFGPCVWELADKGYEAISDALRDDRASREAAAREERLFKQIQELQKEVDSLQESMRQEAERREAEKQTEEWRKAAAEHNYRSCTEGGGSEQTCTAYASCVERGRTDCGDVYEPKIEDDRRASAEAGGGSSGGPESCPAVNPIEPVSGADQWTRQQCMRWAARKACGTLFDHEKMREWFDKIQERCDDPRESSEALVAGSLPSAPLASTSVPRGILPPDYIWVGGITNPFCRIFVPEVGGPTRGVCPWKRGEPDSMQTLLGAGYIGNNCPPTAQPGPDGTCEGRAIKGEGGGTSGIGFIELMHGGLIAVTCDPRACDPV